MSDPSNLIDVAIPLPLDGPFTYKVPSELHARVDIGRRVLVPFRNKIRAGFVVGMTASDPGSQEIKEVVDIPEEGPYLTPGLWLFIRWVADYYMLPIGLVLKTALPPGSDRKSRPWAILTPDGRASSGDAENSQRLTLPAKLIKAGVMTLGELDDLIGANGRKEALKRDWIRIEERIARPRLSLRKKKLPELLDPAGTPVSPTEQLPELTADQRSAVTCIGEAVLKGGFNPFLLFGVTGSGKTEVYLRVIREVLKKGERALVLVPEIALTPQLARRFLRRIGGGVGIFHSGLTPAQRLDEWRRVQAGKVNVAIGARSGIFLPMRDLGLIVVDEEHDPSYKQEDSCP